MSGTEAHHFWCVCKRGALAGSVTAAASSRLLGRWAGFLFWLRQFITELITQDWKSSTETKSRVQFQNKIKLCLQQFLFSNLIISSCVTSGLHVQVDTSATRVKVMFNSDVDRQPLALSYPREFTWTQKQHWYCACVAQTHHLDRKRKEKTYINPSVGKNKGLLLLKYSVQCHLHTAPKTLSKIAVIIAVLSENQSSIQGRRRKNEKTFVIWGSVFVLAPQMGFSCDPPTPTLASFIQQLCISSLITTEPGGCADFSCLVEVHPAPHCLLAVDGWWTCTSGHAAPIHTRTCVRGRWIQRKHLQTTPWSEWIRCCRL